ncbi:protein ENHANCED DOWNY MILDEW 2-like isoform X1 [Asparagus officinalis]|uniref:protein ENHANCED DOWNY MILDEW 2-like isoform X1 n=1 Tax=Asparagus officinalis TaxID=4686 RepID=UPI00098E68EA|nr:protein ENHANCED DOWNY MILDEW 2-like isoform X1 [Asparagus officinalis]
MMASSDDEEELVPQSVTNYYFVDAEEAPISFATLSIMFDGEEKPNASKGQVFLHGTGDEGLQKIYKQVVAWKLGLEDAQPELTVLTKDNRWIKLLKPRKSYEASIRTILITAQLLHFLRRKPESSEKSLWDHLGKIFSSFEDRPSVNDLLDHYPEIKLLVERDAALAKSQVLQMLLKERPRKKTLGVQDLQSDSDSKKSFIVDNDLEEDMGNDDGDESEEEEIFDSVCAICDNGGEILCCEGRCMRSFHATKEDGEDTDCKSLGLSRAQVQAMQSFLCKNCKYKQHQCFVCGKLGSSDKFAGAEVFSCVNATCGRFYHPKCVADLLFQENKAEAAEYEDKVAAGESFTCPVHKCHVCKQGENKEVKELQFAMCRRCPKSYHRKCLPRRIAFDDIEEEGIIQRAWEGLLPHRILIYCLKHKIDEDLGTPIRNHIVFPQIPERSKPADVQKNKRKVLVKKIKQAGEKLSQERPTIKSVNATRKLSRSEENRHVARTSITQEVLNFQKQLKPSKVSAEPGLRKSDGTAQLVSKKSPKEKPKALPATVSSASTGKVVSSSYPKIDVETEKKMIAFMENSTSSLTLEGIAKKLTVPSTHSTTSRNVDKGITLGKVERSVEAVKAALRKLEDGGKVEDAKAVCEPGVLKQLMRWNDKLKVYLAPFLHGMRYTSFGRHFTKVDKLKEIVDRLQWYVKDGDTIVDFCCGANDFSQLMKEKLDATGKKCSFKNYDVIQPKNDFNFEKRDWMTVHPKELPTGSQLIMGLNPPFGVRAALANKFIEKALTFKPKLLILIVPPETERLDRKRPPYDLIWEDSESLAGKSFYLPGSVDVNDMQMDQWNFKAPPLYLWSRPDWTAKHKAIASKQGHTSHFQSETHGEEVSRAQRLDVHPTTEHISERQGNKEDTTVKVSPRERHENKGDTTKKVSPREENNMKIAAESRKRSSPETITRMSNKTKKRKRKEQQETKRKEQQETKRKEQDEAKRKEPEAYDNRKDGELSDMSISPPRERDSGKDVVKGQQLPLEAFEAQRECFQTTTLSYQIPSSQQLPLEAYEAQRECFQTSTLSHQIPSSVVEEEINDIARRYGAPFNRDWSDDRMRNLDYPIRKSEERYPGYNNLDTLNRNSYINGDYGRSFDGDTRMPQSRTYTLPGENDYNQVRLGQTNILPSTSYGLSSSMHGSVTQRYAPQLDEMNHSRASGIPGGRGNIYDMQPPDQFGFASGPPHQYRHHNSGGWLDD